MASEAKSVDTLSAEQQTKIQARIRKLDSYLASNEACLFSTDANFVMSMKDWIDVRKRDVTYRQAKWIDRIWDELSAQDSALVDDE